jgi:protease-4
MTSDANAVGKRRRVWPWVLVAVAFVILLIAATVALVLVAGGGGGGPVGGGKWNEGYVSGEGSNKIAVLPVSGQISGASSGTPLSGQGATPEALKSRLRQAEEDSAVKAVILEVNSPGGGIVASDIMHDEITEFKEKTDKPVVVSMQSMAASGGYYISAPADSIVAHPSTTTGSIGVISFFPDVSGALDKLGIEPQVIKSGEFKDIGSPTEELSEKEREILKQQVEQAYDQFVQVIVDGRGISGERVRQIGDGRTYTGEQAKEINLVDELGDLDTAASNARELAEIDRARVVRYEMPPGFLESLQARIDPPEPRALKLLREAGLDPTVSGPQYLYRPGL